MQIPSNGWLLSSIIEKLSENWSGFSKDNRYKDFSSIRRKIHCERICSEGKLVEGNYGNGVLDGFQMDE